MKKLENRDSLNFNQNYPQINLVRLHLNCRDVLCLVHNLYRYTRATTAALGIWSDIVEKSTRLNKIMFHFFIIFCVKIALKMQEIA